MSIDLDTPMLLSADLEAELAIPMDVAADAACEKLGLPLLGGASGRGWSYFSTASVCPRLFKETYGGADEKNGHELTKPPKELQIGGLYHLLLALFYAYGLGDGQAIYHNRGLLAPALGEKLYGRKRFHKRDFVTIAPTAADQLLAYLKIACDPFEATVSAEQESIVPEARPAAAVLYEAERIFDAYTNLYGAGFEDLIPLAIEWHARHPILGYTCRYDAIVKLGETDPFIQDGRLNPGDVVIIEHKSSKWLSEWALEGWFLDGEILGQLLLWKPSGMEQLFGPLAGLIVDVGTKEKVPRFQRVLIPANPITLHDHERAIRYQKAEIDLWRASGYHPPRWTSCWRFGKRCGLYDKCRADTASAIEEEMVHVE